MPNYYDIFLSHAWKDGEDFDPQDRSKWILGFRDKLLAEMNRPGIWRMKVDTFVDVKEIQSGSIPDHIGRALERTLVFVCLASHTYWQRPYCSTEFTAFGSIIENTPLLPSEDGQKRIIPVLLEPPTPDEWDTLGELKHHDLYDETSGLRFPIDRAGEGLDRMGHIAVSVASVLRSIRGKGGPLYGQGGRVFVGFTPALKAMATGLKSELEYFCVAVKPVVPLPSSREELLQLVSADAAECAMTVHGFDNEFDPGEAETRKPEYEAARLLSQQCALGFPKKVMIWTPERADTVSRRYREAIDELERSRPNGSVELLDVPYPEFQPRFFETLRSIDHSLGWRPRNADEKPQDHKGIYLLRTYSDSLDARYCDFRDWLRNRPLVKVWESADPDQSDAATLLQREEWILEHATAVFVFGSADSVEHFVPMNYKGKLKGWARSTSSLGFYLSVEDSNFSPPKGIMFCSTAPFDPSAAEAAFAPILTSLD